MIYKNPALVHSIFKSFLLVNLKDVLLPELKVAGLPLDVALHQRWVVDLTAMAPVACRLVPEQ